jgi:hypothetical protein
MSEDYTVTVVGTYVNKKVTEPGLMEQSGPTRRNERPSASSRAIHVRFSPESDRLLRCHEVTRWAISDKVHHSKISTSEPRILKQLCRIKYMIESKIPFDAAMTLH